MSHLFRFLADKQHEQQWVIREDDRHHAQKVLRLRDGDAIEVCDGKGSSASAIWNKDAAKSGMVESQKSSFEEEDARKFTLCLGALKHQDIDELIPQLSELGVNELFVYLHGQLERSRIHSRAVERWEKIAERSIKQCKRSWTMKVRSFASLDEMCKALPADGKRLIASVSGTQTVLDIPLGQESHTALVVGSEAGLSPDEEAQLVLKQGFQPVLLSLHVLRAITCALSGSAVLKLRLGQN